MRPGVGALVLSEAAPGVNVEPRKVAARAAGSVAVPEFCDIAGATVPERRSASPSESCLSVKASGGGWSEGAVGSLVKYFEEHNLIDGSVRNHTLDAATHHATANMVVAPRIGEN